MSLTPGVLVRRSAWFHRAIGIAVALGVAAATAVVCGALLVGDSMRGSLRELTLQRLGKIDAAVIPGQFFGANEVTQGIAEGTTAVPTILFSRGVVETYADAADVAVRRSGNVQIVATDASFWDLDTSGVRPGRFPEGDELILNQATADELGVKVGDLVNVRLPREQAVPADSPLGRRDSESEGLPRLKVVAIVPNQGLGRFGLQPSQANPLCAYLPITMVQEVLERPGQANTLLVHLPPSATAETAANVEASLQPSLADFGLQLDRVTASFVPADAEPAFDYYSLTSKRLLLDSRVVDIVTAELGSDVQQPILTYLANAIETLDGKRVVTYSTISAVEPSETLPLNFSLPTADQKDESSFDRTQAVPVAINSWTAQQLEAEVGDPLVVYYYEPETSSGREIEKQFSAIVTEIVPITAPKTPYRRSRPAVFDQAPTVFNDPDFTPTVPGVTDQDSINDWDLPFQLEREVSTEDDQYWNEYRLTPKLFLPLEKGQTLFGSRFGDTTSLRIDISAAANLEALQSRIEQALRKYQNEQGYRLLPIKQQQLAASRGTTPFDALFLSLSFFVIFAALMLVALLFRLGMEQRAREYGTMLAVGMSGRQVARTALAEGTLVSIPGALLGVVAGIGYAMFVIWALSNWWVGAVTVPFLSFHWNATSLAVGFVAGVLMAALTIVVTSRRLRKADIRPLLSGQIPEKPRSYRGLKLIRLGSMVSLLAAAGLGIAATRFSGPAQAGAFVGGGMLLLCSVLGLAYAQLAGWHRARNTTSGLQSYSLGTLALRSVGRNPLRSTLSVGLMAVACFLIVSMSAFQLSPTESGVGGFDLIGQSAVPMYKDLGQAEIRSSFFGRDADKAAGCTVFGLRFRPGQDASCNNLYQATQPQVLGVSESFVQWFQQAKGEKEKSHPAFQWAAQPPTPEDAAAWSPWQELQSDHRGTIDDPVPVILDQNTALWSLQMRGGIGEVRSFTFDDGTERAFRVVGLLSNSVLQGSLIISENNFETLFPEISGYSSFLVRAGDGENPEELATIFENRLSDIGMDMRSTRQVLQNMLAVQNTYLKTFQSLGALGLLLGTLGLAVVQLRNVLERRGELALMRALGFTRLKLAATVMIENLTLLLGGIICGAGAALAAVIPYILLGGANVAILAPLWMLSSVLIVGIAAGSIAVYRVLRMNLLTGLTS